MYTSKFFDAWAKAVEKDLSSLQIIQLDKLTEFRNKLIHHAHETSQTEATFLFHCLKVILETFELETKDAPKNIVKTILILSANPKNTTRLRLDEEVREIQEGLHRSKYRDWFEIHQQWAVRLRDFRRAMLDYEPQIVHFCGHGDEHGLMVEDEHGYATLVSPEALSGLFELFADHIECVVLNACYSDSQAQAINQQIEYVIGMNKNIQDKTAIEFSKY